MSKILIIYSSTDGQTKLICNRIKNNLINKSEVKVIPIDDAEKENDSNCQKIPNLPPNRQF